MKHALAILLLVIIIVLFMFVQRTAENGNGFLFLTPTAMNITSSAFTHEGDIPSKFTCDAANVSPDLSFSEIPEDTASLVLISHDPDAPREGGWTHWVVIDMEPTTTGIAENSKPLSGLETMTDFGKPGYGGPCPPSGTHRYFFYLYALDTTLNLDASTSKADVEAAMEGHILAKAELMARYQRQ